jgi:hypothetical protein
MNPIDQDTALNNIAKIPKQTIGIIEINLGVYMTLTITVINVKNRITIGVIIKIEMNDC